MAATNWLDDALDSVARRMTTMGIEPVGYRRNGRPIWPVMGAAPDDPPADAAAQAAAAAAAQAAAAAAAAAAAGKGKGKVDGEFDFPEGKPLAEMTQAQQTEYWRHKSRKHEDRVSALGNLTPEAIAELQDKAKKHDAMQLDLGSAAEKLAAKAAEDATAAARAALLPQIISSKLEAAATVAGVSTADLDKAIAFVDTSKFLAADGVTVDTAKVTAFVSTIAPAKGPNDERRGPSGGGTGRRPQEGGLSGAEKGHAEAVKRGFVKTA